MKHVDRILEFRTFFRFSPCLSFVFNRKSLPVGITFSFYLCVLVLDVFSKSEETVSETTSHGIPITFESPEDGFVSIVVKDSEGRTVCSLAKAMPVKKGKQSINWHVGSTKHWWTEEQFGKFKNWRKNFGHVPIPDRPWTPVKPGSYTWKGIWRKKFSLSLRGWAYHGSSQPWDVAQTDRWGGEHGVPAACAADSERVYLGWTGNEVGKAMIALDPVENGKAIQDPLWSQVGGFSSVQRIAVDNGIVYFVSANTIAAINAKTGAPHGGPELHKRLSGIWENPSGKPHHINTIEDGFSAADGKLYLTFSDSNLIAQLNAVTGMVVKTFSVSSPGAISAVSGKLVYVTSDSSKVLELNPTNGEFKVAVDGLTNTDCLAVDGKGNLCLSFGYPKPRIDVFSPDGKLLSTMGKARRGVGVPWDRDTLIHSTEMAVDKNGLIWLAEAMHPRRVSVWDPSLGKCVREYFGPTHYGASGAVINPRDPNLVLAEGCEFRIDPETGRSTMLGMVAVPEIPNAARFCESSDGRQFLATVHQGTSWNPRDPRRPKRIEIRERLGEGHYKLRATVVPQPKMRRTAFWADANDDAKEQPEELSYLEAVLDSTVHHLRVICVNSDLTLFGYDAAKKNGLMIKLKGFTDCHAPIYDLVNSKRLPIKRGPVPSPDNRLVLSHDHSYFYCHDVESGKLLWIYANSFSDSGGSHHACKPTRGMIRGAYGIVGAGLLDNAAGAVWAMPTNCGEWHLLSEDGYYLSRLFQPVVSRRGWPNARVGANMDNSPPGHGFEDFGGSLTQGKDGKLYVQAGKLAVWNLGLSGPETIRSLKGGVLRVTAEDVERAGKVPVLSLVP